MPKEIKLLEENKIIREKIEVFQTAFEKSSMAIKGQELDEICPLTHKFADEIYVREIFIPKGFIIIGKIHKHSHPNFLIKGDVSVVTESGGIERLKAPLSMISPAGTKRIVYTHEDTIWQTIHVNKNNERDLNKIEDFVIAKTYDELPNFKDEKKFLKEDEQIEKLKQTIEIEED